MQKSNLLWWVIPGVLAGMPMPFVHPERRMAGGGALTAFDDELPVLHSAGVRAVVSLLNIPSDAAVYESAGFAFLCLPVSDGGAPTMEQANEFVRFVATQRAMGRPVVVHCEAGIGRTGTMLAVYLIAEGASAVAAIQQVRSVEGRAIETRAQIQFLENYAAQIKMRSHEMSPNDKDNWPFDQPRNCATFTTRKVMNRSEPIMRVSHDADDHGWQFIGSSGADMKDAMLVGLEEIVEVDPSVLEVADLPPGWKAVRDAAGAPWRRHVAPPDEEMS